MKKCGKNSSSYVVPHFWIKEFFFLLLKILLLRSLVSDQAYDLFAERKLVLTLLLLCK